MGRKPITADSGDRLKPYTVKLFTSQIEWLNRQENGSAFLRDLLANTMQADTKPAKKDIRQKAKRAPKVK